MNNKQLLKRIVQSGLLLMIGASMNAGAGLFGFGGDNWKEEALQYDGSKIIVKRSQDYGGRHEIGQGSPIKDYYLSFTLPGSSKTIEWKSEYSEDVGRANLHPLALHALNGTSFIIAEPNLCLAYNKWGRPNPPYVIFKYDGRDWQRITIQELPAKFKDMNLVNNTKDHAEKLKAVSVVTAENVQAFNSSLRQLAYQTILRAPTLGDGGPATGCGEMIRVNDGWEGTGFFSGQPSKEACLKYCEKKEVSAQDCPCGRLFKGK